MERVGVFVCVWVEGRTVRWQRPCHPSAASEERVFFSYTASPSLRLSLSPG